MCLFCRKKAAWKKLELLKFAHMQLLLFNNRMQFRNKSLQPAAICLSHSIDIWCMCMAASSSWGKMKGPLLATAAQWMHSGRECKAHADNTICYFSATRTCQLILLDNMNQSVSICITLWLHLLFLRRAMFYICFQGHLHTHQNREGESYEATSEKQKMKYFVIWSLREGSPETCQHS